MLHFLQFIVCIAILLISMAINKHTKRNSRKSHTCHTCQQEGVSSLCSRCKCTYYCNIKCQRADWKYHKKICKSLAQKRQINVNQQKQLISLYKGNIFDMEGVKYFGVLNGLSIGFY
eukprot:415742_1